MISQNSGLHESQELPAQQFKAIHRAKLCILLLNVVNHQFKRKLCILLLNAVNQEKIIEEHMKKCVSDITSKGILEGCYIVLLAETVSYSSPASVTLTANKEEGDFCMEQLLNYLALTGNMDKSSWVFVLRSKWHSLKVETSLEICVNVLKNHILRGSTNLIASKTP